MDDSALEQVFKKVLEAQRRVRHTAAREDRTPFYDIEEEWRALRQWGIERISDSAIRNAVAQYFAQSVPVEFFYAEGSQSGKHVFWHNFEGGLMRHLTECSVSVDRELQKDGDFFNEKNRVSPFWRDLALAANVISDTQKCGIPWGPNSLQNHGEIAANEWRKVVSLSGLDEETIEQIAIAVHYHYGRYTPVPEGCDPIEFKKLTKLAQAVHSVDMASSNIHYGLIYQPVRRIMSPEEAREWLKPL